MRNVKVFLILIFLALITWQCTSDQEPLPDNCLNAITITLNAKSDANCGLADGSIDVTATGLGGNFTYSLNGAAAQASGVFNNLAAGSYTIEAIEAGGCTAEITVEVLNADGVNATLETTESECGGSTGTISVTATGGAGPYEYRLGTGAFQSGVSFSALAPGEYDVTVRDDSGCEVVLQAEITSDVSFGEINTIVQTNCAISGCHDGSQSPDLRSTSGIQNSANRIEIRTGARTMPPGGRTITDAEIAAIACWVADGAPGN